MLDEDDACVAAHEDWDHERRSQHRNPCAPADPAAGHQPPSHSAAAGRSPPGRDSPLQAAFDSMALSPASASGSRRPSPDVWLTNILHEPQTGPSAISSSMQDPASLPCISHELTSTSPLEDSLAEAIKPTCPWFPSQIRHAVAVPSHPESARAPTLALHITSVLMPQLSEDEPALDEEVIAQASVRPPGALPPINLASGWVQL